MKALAQFRKTLFSFLTILKKKNFLQIMMAVIL